jgi:hypothetical protein
MNEKDLIAGLAASAREVPPHADVIGLQALSLEDMRNRTKRFLSEVGEKERRSLDRGDWAPSGDHTVVHLTQGARASFYHASGAMKYVSGMTPMEALFERMEERERSIKVLNEAARRLNIFEWAGHKGEITFERLWQTKAQAADREGKLAQPVLCRIVGAYRQYVGGIPVLGAASVALKLAGNGVLDSLSVQARASAAEVLDKAKVLNPEVAARQVFLQLSSLLGQSKDALPSDLVESQRMQFGYLNLGKRKVQRLLAPAYVAQVVLRHKEERQAYVLAVAASEKTYMPLCPCAHDALPTHARSAQ